MAQNEYNSKEICVDDGKEPIDFFFFQHGITYNTIDPIIHWKYFVDNLKRLLEQNYIFKYNTSNCGLYQTLDGIEEGAERIVEEMCSEFKEIQSKNDERIYRFHFIAHSLGGIYFRVAIPKLFERGIFENKRFIPFTFMTLESPHCGVQKPQNNGTFDYFYKSASKSYFNGKTLTQLSLVDQPYHPQVAPNSSTNSTTDVNIDDKHNIEPIGNDRDMESKRIIEENLPFMIKISGENYTKYLRQFKTLTLVQNIRFSYQVPYVSAAIDRILPYSRPSLKNKFIVEGFDFDESYNDIILSCDKHYEIHHIDELSDDGIVVEKKDGCVLYNKIINQLNQLPWRRLNVHFRTKSKDSHFFIQGDMQRNKYFKNWRNNDVDEYLTVITEIIKRDIDTYII